jgi:hypothetical protein
VFLNKLDIVHKRINVLRILLKNAEKELYELEYDNKVKNNFTIYYLTHGVLVPKFVYGKTCFEKR